MFRRTISLMRHPGPMDDETPDEIPFGLTPEQWACLTDVERLLLMTADTDQPVPAWMTAGASQILDRHGLTRP